MATNRTHLNCIIVAFAAVCLLAATTTERPERAAGGVHEYEVETPADEYHEGEEEELEGRVPRQRGSKRPTVTAVFANESYAPGQVARLVVEAKAPGATLEIVHAGLQAEQPRANDVMDGVPVTAVRSLGRLAGRRTFSIRIGDWPSGLYFARLLAPGGRLGHAPFVLRPRRLGAHRVAVVLPTFTWQAYNWRDNETWYANWKRKTVLLGRPYLDRGVPQFYRRYDEPFLRWLAHTGHDADYFGDADLDAITSGDRLAAAYSLLIFPGHHEYVTEHEYDVVERYRDDGGNLMFLSANNFFWRVDLRDDAIWRIAKWRDLGRPEAGLIGVQYIGDDEGVHRGAWIVSPQGASSWVFDGVGARAGSGFSNGGIEIDKTAPSSPRGTRILAEIPNLFGPGMSAQMTYYETSAAAKVFAAGAFTLAGSIRQRPVQRVIENLWARLSADS